MPPEFFECGDEYGGEGEEPYAERQKEQVHDISLLHEWDVLNFRPRPVKMRLRLGGMLLRND